MQCEASPCAGVLPYGSASQPGKEEKQFIIAPLDPALPDGGSALRQHFVRGEQAGQNGPVNLGTLFSYNPHPTYARSLYGSDGCRHSLQPPGNAGRVFEMW